MKIITAITIWVSLCAVLFAQKPPGSYLQLDGDGDFMQLSTYADSLIFNAPATIEFWARANYDHKSGIGVLWHVNDNNPLLSNGAEYFELTYGNHSGAISNELLNIVYSQGDLSQTNFYFVQDVDGYFQFKWEHYAIVIDNVSYIVFINGQLRAILPNPSAGNALDKLYGDNIDPKVNVTLGGRYLDSTSTYSFDGDIDEFRIWNKALSPSQILNTMHDTLNTAYYSTTDSGLVGYWRFDKAEDLAVGSANPDIRDFSVHGYHGDLQGDAMVEEELFSEIVSIPLDKGYSRSNYWVDYDNDNDLDISSVTNDGLVQIYRNDGQGFTKMNIDLECGTNYYADWGDYNNDNFTDLVVGSKIYRNDNGTGFTDINANLTAGYNNFVAWGDYNNDGFMDVFQTGFPQNGGGPFSKIYRNQISNGSGFADIGTHFYNHYDGIMAWGDYDNDGDLDIVLNFQNNSYLYRNDDSTFTEIPFYPGHSLNSSNTVNWVDFDQDGDLDIYIDGKIFRNNDSTFTDKQVSILGSGASWGDYDNDGDPDIVDNYYIYLNEDSTLNRISIFPQSISSPQWGDYDNDGDLDIVVTQGSDIKVFRNNYNNFNTAPSSPSNLESLTSVDTVILSWDAANDAETASAGLTYNIRIGTSPGGSDVVSPIAGNDGYRRIVQMGNVNQNLSWKINNLSSNTTYYWSVQAIDNSFAGGPWADEQQFFTGVTSIDEPQTEIPQKFALKHNYPNPFNPSTTIEYHIAKASAVELKIYNSNGQLIHTLVNGFKSPGVYNITWDATGFSSGIYYYVLKAGAFQEVQKSILIK